MLEIVETYGRAEELTREDALREGNLLRFPNYGQLVMTGDLHGHARNFEKLVSFCDLARYPDRHVILHEILHGTAPDRGETCFSFRVLESAVRLKTQFPEQVHFLLSNHDLAQAMNHAISKVGKNEVEALRAGLRADYGEEAETVHEALRQFIFSQPLAGLTPNHIFLSHALPGPTYLADFDPSVLSRPLKEKDYDQGGSVWSFVWGRSSTDRTLHRIRNLLGLEIDWFVVGHQPQEFGFACPNSRQIILASDHGHGAFLPITLSREYDLQSLVAAIVKFAAIP